MLWLALWLASGLLLVLWCWAWAHTWVERDRGSIPLWRYLASKARQEDP